MELVYMPVLEAVFWGFESPLRHQFPVTTFLKVAWGHDMIPVARAPTALLVTDNLAAWTLRRPYAK